MPLQHRRFFIFIVTDSYGYRLPFGREFGPEPGGELYRFTLRCLTNFTPTINNNTTRREVLWTPTS